MVENLEKNKTNLSYRLKRGFHFHPPGQNYHSCAGPRGKTRGLRGTSEGSYPQRSFAEPITRDLLVRRMQSSARGKSKNCPSSRAMSGARVSPASWKQLQNPGLPLTLPARKVQRLSLFQSRTRGERKECRTEYHACDDASWVYWEKAHQKTVE